MVFLKSHDMVGLIDDTNPTPAKTLPDDSPNPEYTRWVKQDNSVLNWLYASIVEKLVSTVLNLETSKQVWDSLQARFSSTLRSRIAFLKWQLQTISQENRFYISYIEEAKLLADQLFATSKPVEEQDLITYFLSGLKQQYMPFVTAFTFATRDKEFSLDDFQTEILIFEPLMKPSTTSIPAETTFAFAATQSKPGYLKKNKCPGFSSQNRLLNRPSVPMGSSNNKPNAQQSVDNRPICQICGKKGHTALDCYDRFNLSYQVRLPLLDLAAMVAEGNTSYAQQVWYTNSGVNAHITNNTANLTAS